MKFLGDPSSGSKAGTTFSRNRFGQYQRTRATPVNPASTFQGVVRARMSTNAAGWRALTDAQRNGWTTLGASITRTDSLGQTYTLNGFMAYCSVNNNLLAAGDAILSTAPSVITPANLLTVTLTLTSAAFSIAYTTTPLATGVRLFTFVSPGMSPGRKFNANYRLLSVSAAAAASPADVFAAYSARFGAPVTGERIFLSLQTYKGGFLSGPFTLSQVVA